VTRWLALWIHLAVLLLAGTVLAQGGVSVELSTARRAVEVNTPFRVTLSATSAGDDVRSATPTLRPPPGITIVGGPSVGTQQQMTISGGRTSMRTGIRATWVLQATRTGRFTIGPALVAVGGSQVRSNTISVEVVPVGQGRQLQPRNPWGPLMPPGWPSPFGFPGDPGLQLDDEPLDPDRLPPYPRELATDKALDDIAFLTATVSPRRVVVGEPTTLRIVAYGRGGRFTEGKTTEPATSSFVSYPIHDTSYGMDAYRVPIGDQVWTALIAREVVLYPVDTGTLTIGGMTMEFLTPHGRPYMGRQIVRSSPAVELVVTEPPQAGRPPGYVLGDVGRFNLRANVQPREVTAGQAVSVIVKVEGEGNFPNRLPMPQQNGVEWLQPTITDAVDIDGGRLRGTKTFSYVVRLQKTGRVALGQLRLQYWDPVRRAYESTHADLGSVVVKPSQESTDAREEAVDRLAVVTEPRLVLGAPPREPLRWGDRPWFWVLLGLGPVGVVLVAGVARAGLSLSERWRVQRESLATQVARALTEARRSAERGDAAATASAGERALFSAIEDATKIRARGVLRDDLRDKLLEARIPESLAAEIDELLAQFDAVRFTGSADLAPTELLNRVQHCIRFVKRLSRGRGKA